MVNLIEQYDRRRFLRQLVTGAGIFIAPQFLCKKALAYEAAKQSEDPHFFLHIVFSEGRDASYMFDARPLEMTDRGLVQNYLYKAKAPLVDGPKDPRPIIYRGTNGATTLRSPLTEPLMKFSSQFTIINGVIMSPDMDGHENNLQMLLTGKPSGVGPSILPILGDLGTRHFSLENKTPIASALITPSNQIKASNTDHSIVVNGAGFSRLKGRLNTYAFSKSRARDLVADRLAQIAAKQDPGMFTQGAAKMLNGLQKMDDLAARINQMESNNVRGGSAEEVKQVKEILQLFKAGITTSGSLILSDSRAFDAHDPERCSAQPQSFQRHIKVLAEMLSVLSTTEYKSGKSFLDVTTVVISSEFNRTLRQNGVAIDATGTDHNTLANSMMVLGKGIKGGQVIGASDLDVLDAQGKFDKVSTAHHSKDPDLLKLMGKPYDFATGAIIDAPEQQFLTDQHITIASVSNALIGLFGGIEQDLQKNSSSISVATPLNQILKG